MGAVAMAQPRPSLRDPRVTSATASVFCFPGHKEDVIAKETSEKLSAALNANVVVTAGIHWDHLQEEGIQSVIRNSEKLVAVILEKMGKREKKERPTEPPHGARV
jgi:hypothetical protein